MDSAQYDYWVESLTPKLWGVGHLLVSVSSSTLPIPKDILLEVISRSTRTECCELGASRQNSTYADD